MFIWRRKLNNKINIEFTKENTNLAKMIAILLMFIHHLFAFPEKIKNVNYISLFTINGIQIEYYIGLFGKICVAIFLVLAGYGTYISLKDKSNLTEKIFNKIKMLYLKYWKIFIIFIPVSILLGIKRVEVEPIKLLYNFFAVKITYNGEWWFLTPYIVITLFTPIIFKWVDRKNASIIKDFFLIITLAVFVQNILPEIMKNKIFDDFVNTLYFTITKRALTLLPQYLMGCLIAKYNLFAKFREKFKKKIGLYSISILIIIGTIIIRQSLGGKGDYIYAPLFIIAITSLLQDLKYLSIISSKISLVFAEMWLIHSFYCYHFLQKFVFAPKYSILILLLLIITSYFSAVLINVIFKYIGKITKKYYSHLKE